MHLSYWSMKLMWVVIKSMEEFILVCVDVGNVAEATIWFQYTVINELYELMCYMSRRVGDWNHINFL